MMESELKNKFKEFLKKNRFNIIRESINTSPDFIIEKNGKKIGVELKSSANTSWFAKGLGQLNFSKIMHNVDDLWLIISKIPKSLSREWFQVFQVHGVNLFLLNGNEIIKITSDLLMSRPWIVSPGTKKEKKRISTKQRCIEIDQEIFNLLQNRPNGLTIGKISRKLGIHYETAQAHIYGQLGSMTRFCDLKDKITIENDKIKLLQFAINR